mgnify:CR=1 FL=1
MPTLRLKELLCRRPKEARDDEIYINLRTEDISRVRHRSRDEGNPLWGPVRMEEGDTIDYIDGSTRDRLDPIEFQEFAHIALWEDDRHPGRDNLIGEFTLRRNTDPGENIPIWLPRGLFGPNHQSYRLIYDLREEPLAEIRNRIDLLQLNCNNPQGTRDRVELIVNDEMVWSSWDTGDMRRGDERTLHNVFYHFNEQATVVLRETQGQEWQASFTVGADEVEEPHIFRVDSGIVGDAQYTLQYSVSPVPG